MNNCPQPALAATATIVAGTSITLTLPAAVTAPPPLGQCLNFYITGDIAPLAGTEEVIIAVGANTYALVDNCGLYVIAQMLGCITSRDCHGVRRRVYKIQFGAAGTESVFYARRGFVPRRGFFNLAVPPTP